MTINEIVSVITGGAILTDERVVMGVIYRIAAECYQQGVLDAKSKHNWIEHEGCLIDTVTGAVISHIYESVDEDEPTIWLYEAFDETWVLPTKEEAEASRVALIKQLMETKDA